MMRQNIQNSREYEIKLYNNTKVDPNDYEIDILTCFPNHSDRTKRNQFLPLGYARNPNNYAEEELLVKIPPTKREFRIRFKYVGRHSFTRDESVCIFTIFLNGLQVSSFMMETNPTAKKVTLGNLHSDGNVYPFEFGAVKGGTRSTVDGIFMEHDEGLDSFGIKITVIKVGGSQISSTAMIKTDFFQEPVFKDVTVSDNDSKLHGGKVNLGNPQVSVTAPRSLLLKGSRFDTSILDYVIRFCNQINLLQWVTKMWKIDDLKDVYEPFEYEEDEDPVLREIDSQQPDIKPKIEMDVKPDVKREREDSHIIDLCEDDDEPVTQKKKTPIYRQWSVADVSKWLKRTDSEWERLGYDKMFERNEIDGVCMEDLNHDGLISIGVAVGAHRIKILKSIKDLER